MNSSTASCATRAIASSMTVLSIASSVECVIVANADTSVSACTAIEVAMKNVFAK